MAKYMISFGHGYSKKGAYDSGAVHGSFKEEEMVRKLKEPLKKWAKEAGITLHFYDNNMYADQSIASYKGYILTELHLDAPKGNGGHVIIHNAFKPDAIDERLAAFIKKNFDTVGYVGADGINERDDLYNCNMAKSLGINYRLLELFFLSNDDDRNYYLNNLDKVAKELIEALTGKTITVKSPATPKPSETKPSTSQKTYKVIKGDSLWAIAKKYGVTVANLRGWNNLKTDIIQPNQVLKVSKPVVDDGSIGSLQVITAQLWYYNKADWNAKHGIAKKGEIFTVMQKLKVDDAWMYRLKSGMFITANTSYVSFKSN